MWFSTYRQALRFCFRPTRQNLIIGAVYRYTNEPTGYYANVAQVTELLGHKDTGMVMRHYSKLRHRPEHQREQLSRVTHLTDANGRTARLPSCL